MNKKNLISLALFISATLFLLPNFYRNNWSIVEPGYYKEWQIRYDRLVVARLVKTRQDGFLSAGALMGLGDETEWGFQTRTNQHQFNSYLNQGKFESYLVYKSNPGFQGFMYGLADKVLPIAENQKLKVFRGFTALMSAIVFGVMIAFTAVEFGLLSSILTLAFVLVSMWIVLPAGSIFWDYWAFYAPFLASIFVLAEASWKGTYNARKVHTFLFVAVLVKILLSGFDLTTTTLVMTTVPFVFYGIRDRWEIKTFITRMIKAGLVLLAATITGLVVLGIQIIASEGSSANAYMYLLNRFTSHTGGNYDYFLGQNVPPREIHVMEVLPKYFMMPAIDIQLPAITIQILYWHLIVVFAIFTVAYLVIQKLRSKSSQLSPKALALVTSTWYSILAPISWYVTFKPHSFIHTHVNTMGWQMPFTLLGFALCGFVITDLFSIPQRNPVTVEASPASQND